MRCSLTPSVPSDQTHESALQDTATARPPARVSVVIAAFDLARWTLLERAVNSALGQASRPQVVIAIDNNEQLFDRAVSAFDRAKVVLNRRERGASVTRNTGAAAAEGEILAFLDDDAEAGQDWLVRLTEPLVSNADIVGVGGGVQPMWPTQAPGWFPMEFGWVIGASYTGLPTKPGPIRNVWSENMAIRATDFHSVGGFREGFGKIGNSSRPEDTEFCLRLQSANPGHYWWFEPDAVISHHVPPGRATFSFFMRRCIAEGRGKAGLAGFVGSANALSSEKSYVSRTLSAGMLRGLRDGARGDIDGFKRAAAIGVGGALAAIGYAVEVGKSHNCRAVVIDDNAVPLPQAQAAHEPATPQSAPGVPAIHSLARIVELDVARPLPGIGPPEEGDPAAALVVVWLCRDPVGMVLVSEPVAADELAQKVQAELGRLLAVLLPQHGLPVTELTSAGFTHGQCRVNAAFETVAAGGPSISVVLCTRNRAESLQRCIESIGQLVYSDFELIVVDNAPSDDASERVCRRMSERMPLRYLREDAPGLSWARNRGVAEARNPIIAFLDDDERVHADWLTGLALEFAEHSTVGVVSGLVLPAELRRESQVDFERFGGHSKGRGFHRVVFDKSYLERKQSALYPFPPFGVGANMAFRRQSLDDIGGFDVALGAGTVTGGAEDTASLTEALLAGWTMVYAPRAVTWHYHRSDVGGMGAQLNGYARGIGAYYTALVLRDPRRLIDLLRLIAPALRDLGSRQRGSGLVAQSDTSAEEISGNNPGLRIRPMLGGPFAYLNARRIVRTRRVLETE
jgi:glycosyltransferase involved in cell wall biosynthesis